MSLYLKYRPKDFSNLVGQDFIKDTLKNAIIKDSLVGAYIFCGPRGTGKTSTARIFAKTINCLDLKDGVACDKCDICKNFNENRLTDIIEIDAASYTGVDNIRDIIDKAKFRPNSAKYKVYIIDEVHMLSKGAFNALLKILEEPPEYVKFILATTDVHKVPDTILSRCQRYDFRSGSNENIKKRLNYIAERESIKIDEKSLNYIVKTSSGGYRDAIKLFEQLIINDEVIFENIINNLGIVGEEVLEIFLDKLVSKDNSILDDFDKFIENGKDTKLFLKELIYFVKDQIIEKVKNNKEILNYLFILDKLNETYSKINFSMDENITFLIGLLQVLNEGKKENSQILEKAKTNNKINIKPEKKQEAKIEETAKEKKSEKISSEDVLDIFSDNSFEENKKEAESDSSDDTFDKENFVKTLKELGAKGKLVLGVKGGDISFDGDRFILKLKSQFALNSINNIDDKNLLEEALKKNGMDGFEIILTS